jgi:hypothetical protein
MARLRSLDYGTPWLWGMFPESGDPRKNGPYRGPLSVRHIAPAVYGSDLVAAKEPPAAGQLWRRGAQLVRITRVTERRIAFRDLTHSGAVRTVFRSHFLRTSRRQAS